MIPYFERWLARFPTVAALAEAPIDEVLGLWSGLGYYARARNLHRGAQAVVARHQGILPRSPQALRDLPGIGRYTAGAISSIAFGLPEPLVDGNVARVLARLYALDGDIKSSATSRALWHLAGQLVPADAPGEFNQGLMELGATVCTPTRPTCLVCPLVDCCQARRQGREHELPRMPKRKRAAELPLLDCAALWIERRGRLLLARRRGDGLYGGLWELPQIALADRDSAETSTETSTETSALDALLTGMLTAKLRPLAAVPAYEHHQTLTHRRLRIRVFAVQLAPRTPAKLAAGARSQYDQLVWHRLRAQFAHGLSAATQAIIDAHTGHLHGE